MAMVDFTSFEALIDPTLREIIILYLGYQAAAIAIAAVLSELNLVRKKTVEDLEISPLLPFSLLLEDWLFRWLPIHDLGGAAPQIFHVLWALCHGMAAPAVAVSGLIEYRLYLAGYWAAGYLLHLAHDVLIMSLALWSRRRNKP